VPTRPPLIVVPVHMTENHHAQLLAQLIKSLNETTAPHEFEFLIVDDGSPRGDLVHRVSIYAGENIDHYGLRRIPHSGFSKAVNVGLREAIERKQDVILCNADIKFIDPGWLKRFQDTNADVIGALLLFPNGMIQHAGTYYSVIYREFDHRFRFCPNDLVEAMKQCRCPVTAALQYIRYDTLTTIGIYDEEFRMGFEDVDYCHRVFLGGGNCLYTPQVRALHYESAFRGDKKIRTSEKIQEWQRTSREHLAKKYAGQSFADFVPTLLLDEFQ
jgi:O-antigen biosynthesis protein